MYHWHALPENWEHMVYSEFLEQRRELTAQIIFEGYKNLTSKHHKKKRAADKQSLYLVGARGFEPPTSCTPFSGECVHRI